MELRNITESILVDLVDSLEDVKNKIINKNQKLELIAYVLNRLKPVYVTSSKGFMNVLVKFQNDPQFYADMMVQLNDGLIAVKNMISDQLIPDDDFQLLRNITEYIVVDMVNELGDIPENQKFELFSYILNRLKPLYITNDKKFPEIIKNWKNNADFVNNIKNKINEGFVAVKKIGITEEREERLDLNAAYYGFPKIYGKIISSISFMYLETAKVTLLIDSQIAQSLYSDMDNPVELIPDDRGIYSFAPKPARAEKESEKKLFILTILIQKEGREYKKILTYETESVLGDAVLFNYQENILSIEDIYVPF